jgi:hypothetical protein
VWLRHDLLSCMKRSEYGWNWSLVELVCIELWKRP